MSIPLVAALHRLPKLRALVVGDLVADRFVYGVTERVSREAPVLVVRHESEEIKLGGAANVAANLRALGMRVELIGVVGADAAGRAVQEALQERQIGFYGVVSGQVDTETKTRILAGAKGTTRQQMLRLDSGGTSSLSDEVLSELGGKIDRVSASVDVVVVSDYGSGLVRGAVRDALLKLCKRKKKLVCVDSRYGLSELPGATLCKPNEPELGELTGLPLKSDGDVLRALAAARTRLRCDHVVATRGQRGIAVLSRSRKTTTLPPFGPPEAVDVTGAGDTVLACLSAVLALGRTVEEAAWVANVAAGIKVQHMGTYAVSAKEIEAAATRGRPT